MQYYRIEPLANEAIECQYHRTLIEPAHHTAVNPCLGHRKHQA